MDVNLTVVNARAHTGGHDDWSPSKPGYLPTHWRLRLLQGIEQGRRRFAQRQAELDAKLTEREADDQDGTIEP